MLNRPLRHAAALSLLAASFLAAQQDTTRKDSAATALPTVKVEARRNVTTTNRDGFADRKALGLGTFFDSTAVRQMDGGRLSERLRGVGGLRLVQYQDRELQGWYQPEIRAASSIRQGPDGGPCWSTIIYDNVTMYKAGSRGRPPDLRREFDITGLEAIEFYRGSAQAPLGLAAEADCGILVLWSRRKR